MEDETRFEPENIPLNIVYEDDDIIVINKPKDLVVHPGAGNPNGTVLNALLYHYPPIAEVPRAGIVHRLDKDTTGLMVVAKTIPAQTKLVRDLQKRKITREYEAVASGIMTKGGTVDQPMARHATKRTLMAVHPMGKPAVTHYRIMENYRNYTPFTFTFRNRAYPSNSCSYGTYCPSITRRSNLWRTPSSPKMQVKTLWKYCVISNAKLYMRLCYVYPIQLQGR